MISLPRSLASDPRNVTPGVQILSEWAFGIDLTDEKMVATERGVVEQEWRSSNQVGMRLYQGWLQTVLAGHRLARRLPIGGKGDEAGIRDVRHAPAQRILDFYRTWYRPELCAVVAIGDFESHDQVKALIKQYFDPWERTPEAKYGHLPRYLPDPTPVAGDPITLVQADGELTSANLTFGWLGPRRTWAATPRNLRQRIIEDCAGSIFYDRMNRLIDGSGADPPFSWATGFACDTLEVSNLSVSVSLCLFVSVFGSVFVCVSLWLYKCQSVCYICESDSRFVCL